MQKFPTLAEFELMPFEAQLKFYQQKVKGDKFNTYAPIWAEQLRVAIEENRPLGLIIFPPLVKFYQNFRKS